MCCTVLIITLWVFVGNLPEIWWCRFISFCNLSFKGGLMKVLELGLFLVAQPCLGVSKSNKLIA